MIPQAPYPTTSPWSNVCLKCGKPFIYIGDPVGNLEDLICTCHGTTTYPNKETYNYGWLCPRCNKVNAPWKGQCDCII